MTNLRGCIWKVRYKRIYWSFGWRLIMLQRFIEYLLECLVKRIWSIYIMGLKVRNWRTILKDGCNYEQSNFVLVILWNWSKYCWTRSLQGSYRNHKESTLMLDCTSQWMLICWCLIKERRNWWWNWHRMDWLYDDCRRTWCSLKVWR